MALHRPAEFNKSHVPAFLAGEEAGAYVCVYPFVRSYEWYLLPDEERRELLAEHGKMARGYPDVRANTVASFALGDYEWILAFEADELHRIVDLMRDLRASRARRHVREEIPFYTGRRRPVAEIVRRAAVGATVRRRRPHMLTVRSGMSVSGSNRTTTVSLSGDGTATVFSLVNRTVSGGTPWLNGSVSHSASGTAASWPKNRLSVRT